MNTPSNAMPHDFEAHRITAENVSATRPLYWSIRRELWENRFIYIAPLAVAGVVLFAFSVSAILGIWESALRLHSAHGGDEIATPYDLAAGLMMLTTILVSVFYCLDALHGERRDRSILFWKSLPVSDVTTVLAKASIPLVVLPLLVCAVIVAVQWIMLLVSSAVLLVRGQSVTAFWAQLSFFRMAMVTLYHLVTAHALWPFPVYCWLLLVSGWARRATFLWAALPLIAIAGVEQIVFHTWHFAELVGSRLIGNTPTPGNMFPTGPMTHITPGIFLTSPGLWIGFAVAAIFLAAAVRLRRYQGPI
ncbi:MAG: ABC transporter permease [Acidobacteria bacterium]|nr:MAG: ABC transporter permease [Acidobacteriota bacterium]